MKLGLDKKNIIVTGGASGIGKAVVTGLLSEGSSVIVIDKDREKLAELKANCGGSENTNLITYLCELSDSYKTDLVIQQIRAENSEIYGLVNNAGNNDGVGLSSDTSEFLLSLQKNLVHYFQLVSGFSEQLKQSRGSIVNVSSKVAFTGQGGTSGYAASKGAINALTREWAVEFAPYGVDVNCVIPAEVMTPQYEQWIATQEGKGRLNSILKKINLGTRLTTSEEVADYIIFLLSQKCSHTTGQLLFVDGGYTHLDDSKN